MDGESKNPRSNETFLTLWSGRALSLVTFFAPAKKVTRPNGETLFNSEAAQASDNETDQPQYGYEAI